MYVLGGIVSGFAYPMSTCVKTQHFRLVFLSSNLPLGNYQRALLSSIDMMAPSGTISILAYKHGFYAKTNYSKLM